MVLIQTHYSDILMKWHNKFTYNIPMHGKQSGSWALLSSIGFIHLANGQFQTAAKHLGLMSTF